MQKKKLVDYVNLLFNNQIEELLKKGFIKKLKSYGSLAYEITQKGIDFYEKNKYILSDDLVIEWTPEDEEPTKH